MVGPKDSGIVLPTSSGQLELLLASINHGDNLSSSKTISNEENPGLFQRSAAQFLDYHHPASSFLHENHAFGLNSVPSEKLSRKRSFMIFDQSGNETRIVYASTIPYIPKQAPTPMKQNDRHIVSELFGAALSPEKSNFGEEDGEMHENTEEINALLYSDEFDDESDEEASTGHSPVLDDSASGSNKRQRTANVGHAVRTSISDTASSLRSHGSHSRPVVNDDESGCAPAADADEVASVRDRIQAKLRVLESIVPGTKGHKNPLLVLDQAIDYLKSLKVKVQVLGVMSDGRGVDDDDDAVEGKNYSVFKI